MEKCKLVFRFLIHQLTSRNTGGYGVHSPFMFHFTMFVLSEKNPFSAYFSIEELRRKLKKDKRILNVRDYGTRPSCQRKVCDIAHTAVKSKKYGQLLFRISNHFKVKNALELGTSLGLSTAYICTPNSEMKCLTLEGCPEIASIAKENLKILGIKNASVMVGNIDELLPCVVEKNEEFDLVFIDANHTFEATTFYFNTCLAKLNKNSILLIDDIHSSTDMCRAWDFVKSNTRVISTIDLFSVGIVFFNPDLPRKHYKMRF